MNNIFKVTCNEGGINSLVLLLHRELSREASPFCLWLKGDLGAGKTTLVRRYLHSIGLEASYPVNSPTFTYIQEYEIKGNWYAHLDLYRLIESVSVDEFSLIGDYRNFCGFFVEWPEALHNPAILFPSHILEISFDNNKQGEDRRTYTLYDNQRMPQQQKP